MAPRAEMAVDPAAKARRARGEARCGALGLLLSPLAVDGGAGGCCASSVPATAPSPSSVCDDVDFGCRKARNCTSRMTLATVFDEVCKYTVVISERRVDCEAWVWMGIYIDTTAWHSRGDI